MDSIIIDVVICVEWFESFFVRRTLLTAQGEKGQRAAKEEIAKWKNQSADYKIQIDALKQAQEKSRSDLKDVDLNFAELKEEHEKTVISLDTAKGMVIGLNTCDVRIRVS